MMPIFIVRRSGNSLVLTLTSRMARELELKEGDKVLASIEKLPSLLEMAGKLKGKATADELNALTNEGEDLG
jgi:antitoxin component of MazEF toxin-antitoxin module